MNLGGLTPQEGDLIREVLGRHPEVTEARIFGSRAKGTHRPNSDVDLALGGDVPRLLAATIQGELEELPIPYIFDVQAYNDIHHPPLREHIERVGLPIYRKT